MVAYDHPVFRNGHRVLWHGPLRGKGGAKAALTAAGGAIPGAAAEALPPVKLRDFVILADSADPVASRMAGEFAVAMQAGGVHVRPVFGRTSQLALAKAVASDSADLAIAPVDSVLNAAKDAPDWRVNVPYVARLANEPITLIAPRAITDVSQLAGRKVSVDAVDSATAASAGLLFSRLHLAPKLTNQALADGLIALASGKLDAVFVVGGSASKSLADFGKDGRFHILPIALTSGLRPFYSPARASAADWPNLLRTDERIDTLGVPMALLALDAGPESPRVAQIGMLAGRFFESFDKLLAPGGEPSWRDVNLAASLTAWPRLGPAQAWVNQNKGAADPALDSFRSLAQTASATSDGPSGADADRLYESLMRWRGATK